MKPLSNYTCVMNPSPIPNKVGRHIIEGTENGRTYSDVRVKIRKILM